MKTGAALFILAFLAAVRTACPTVAFDDTGETCLAALEIGIPHPPGYPFFTLLTSLFIHIIPGSIAFRLNALAAVLAGVSASIAYAFWRRTATGGRLVGAVAAIMAVLSMPSWGQAGTAKGGVYMLNMALTMGMLSAAWGGGPSVRGAMSVGVLFGLGLAHHWMSVIGLVPLFTWVILRANGGPVFRRAVLGILAAVAGASLYLVLPIRSVAEPFLNWGQPGKLAGLLFSLGRRQYLGTLPSEATATLSDKLSWSAGALDGAAPWWILLPLAAFGAWEWRRRGKWAVTALALIPTSVFAGLFLVVPVRPGAHWFVETYAVTAVALLSLMACAGLASLAVRLSPGKGVQAAAAALLLFAAFAIPTRWRANDRSGDYFTWDMAVNLAGTSPTGRGIIYGASDAVVFGNWYLWQVERRTGVAVVPVPLLPMPWVAESFPELVPGLRAPYPAPHVGAESIPALLKAWGEANSEWYPEWTFMTDQSMAAFGSARLKSEGWMYRLAGSGRGAGEGTGMRHLRMRGLFGSALSRDGRQDASIRPICFSGMLSWGRGLADNDLEGARRAFRGARRLSWSDADTAETLLEEGNLEATRGSKPVAEALFRQSSRLDPSLTVARRNLAMLLLSMHRNREALEIIEKIGADEPESAEARELSALIPRLEKSPRTMDNIPR